MVQNRAPSTDLCGTPDIKECDVEKDSLTQTLYDLFARYDVNQRSEISITPYRFLRRYTNVL